MNRNSTTLAGIVVTVSIVLLILTVPGVAQHEPYITHETRAVITHGPYLLAPGETSMTVVWITDTPCHSRVEYGAGGELSLTAEPHEHGLVPIGTRHVVHLTGLQPGTTYNYRAVSTRVVRMKQYWPEKGLPVESPVYSFTTLDRSRAHVSFSVITDTHEDVRRINGLFAQIDWPATDFLVHGGDAFGGIDTEEHLFSVWLDPTIKALDYRKAMVFVRGNHEMRGSFARKLYDYVPAPEGRYYYSRDHGPMHLIVLDTGEDKPDDTNVYAGLNRMVPYREEQLRWFRDQVAANPRISEAPFRVILMHQPSFGWVADRNQAWVEVANQAKVDLIISGHRHRFSWTAPGERENQYHHLVLGQDQVAQVDVSSRELKVTVKGIDGALVDTRVIPRR